ncbi:aspartyl-tRNA synthetase [Buchnera aphidicola str. Bp (Baizongia pistaciae)]|uniref:Aspartate--tRNA ligase n=1 Tax=Buchnera aphidicola subsp. Baizongia pistaciae (strain Bp) TaxID=224915 RepID=SYD_BUCBP|nr:aspartate--tRNA ligase [Buchnera aphidicola]P59422.1 RecName: Full=Aspartate--tRNA ligase; AltName: Full=Aspartyl-tRNA synthetase; Short=AspRS [Buchnera aphidicola str. Bp (Baizongia pistaciae)]AAO27018.1 aspartyl-tRNA synthetase [Buchnera aphidicola str. Bp (Baizongia pistaciae)]
MRTNFCGTLNVSHVGKTIKLCGWVNKFRNLKEILFIDIRDQTGIIQVLFSKKSELLFKKAADLRNEFCIQVLGIVQERITKNKNYTMSTGEIEIFALELKIFNKSQPLPIDLKSCNIEETRLKFRYLDLRHPNMIRNIIIRNDITIIIRNFMKKNKFLDIETPILTKSTPEGARDYIVPSRIHKNKYYALPQSPQLFKQLLMISGIDRYYQIAKCFRDEDLRSDRQPEFTQIDIEVSFLNAKKVRKIIERMITSVWNKIINVHLKKFQKLSFYDAIKMYGTDKPDLRNPIQLIDVTNIIHVKNNINAITLPNKKTQQNIVIAMCIPRGMSLNINYINSYHHLVQKYTKNKLFNVEVLNHCPIKEQKKTSFHKKPSSDLTFQLISKTSAKHGDMIFYLSEKSPLVYEIMGKLRIELGKDLNLIDYNSWKPLWITNFPLFKKNELNQYISTHHPFTAPKYMKIDTSITNYEEIVADSYDLVINGYEIGSGSVRIHDLELQKTVFNILGINTVLQKNNFNFFLNALKYGTPPHAGIALGLDRITMLLTNSHNLRDVIAFPKTTTGSCLTTGAPSKIIHF